METLQQISQNLTEIYLQKVYMTKRKKPSKKKTNLRISPTEEKDKPSQETSKAKKKLKQIENILSQRLIVLPELKSVAWNGIPFG